MSKLSAFTTGRTWNDGGVTTTTVIDVDCNAEITQGEDGRITIRWRAAHDFNTQMVEVRLPVFYSERLMNDLAFVLSTARVEVTA